MTTDDDIPESIAEAEMDIGGIKVKVHVLSDGRRIVAAEDMERVMMLLFGNVAKGRDS